MSDYIYSHDKLISIKILFKKLKISNRFTYVHTFEYKHFLNVYTFYMNEYVSYYGCLVLHIK